MPGNSRESRPTYTTETAASLATRRIPTADLHATAGEVLRRLRSGAFEAIEIVVVTNPDGTYAGIVNAASILAAKDETPIATLISRDWPRVDPETDQEHAVHAALLARASAVPVIAKDGRPVGVIRPHTLLDVLASEHREDVHRLVGIMKERAGARHALEDPPLRRVAYRLPWLLVGLGLSSLATGVMASFERALQANVIIAFFIPALVYLTDAIGTQTEAIAVRGLSLRKKPLASILAMEALTGATIGLILGAVAVLGVWLVFGDFAVGLGVGLSLFIAGTLASTIGLLLPWCLSRFNLDPAFGSGPVATIVQDVLTILVYFLVMTEILTRAG
jgi:magnesium transporter